MSLDLALQVSVQRPQARECAGCRRGVSCECFNLQLHSQPKPPPPAAALAGVTRRRLAILPALY